MSKKLRFIKRRASSIKMLCYICVWMLLFCSCAAKEEGLENGAQPSVLIGQMVDAKVADSALAETAEVTETPVLVQETLETTEAPALPQETPETTEAPALPQETPETTEAPVLPRETPESPASSQKTSELTESSVSLPETPQPTELPVYLKTPTASVISAQGETEIPPQSEKPVLLETPPSSEPIKIPAPQEVPDAATVTISVYSADAYILGETEVEWEQGQTVFDVLKQVTRNNEIHMDFTGRGAGVYITGIGNLYEFDMGAESGWVYYVNGEYAGKSAGAHQLAEGDIIQWKYTRKLGDLSE